MAHFIENFPQTLAIFLLLFSPSAEPYRQQNPRVCGRIFSEEKLEKNFGIQARDYLHGLEVILSIPKPFYCSFEPSYYVFSVWL